MIRNKILNSWIENQDLDIFNSARAAAYLNVGMYDSIVSTWHTKFKYWTERPFQAIPSLVTVIDTPNFPGYTSGHSTLSGAASTIMAELFPSDKEYFISQATEASMSQAVGRHRLIARSQRRIDTRTKDKWQNH